ncbi:M48 family metalloprotease [uncultured Methylobacterium sp.]|uniref:M48 family metalloprotease n=1 Tax=uncultured Methylobacterium sp. TaxID=157278 RepID=UPI0035CA337E
MFLRVNGLYGWVRVNDRRSLALFAGFLAAFHVAAVLTLYVPLIAFDPEHAPVFAWGGYAARYLLLVTVAAVALFALLMLWHVKSVQRQLAFTFVDNADEPRLCRIVEPLAIGMGLPAPYVGIVESTALNAFACGLSAKNAVVVVTRGLIDGLDDDELASVLAHELAHIANGDIRVLAAANTCLRLIGWLVQPRFRTGNILREMVAFPVIMVVMPPLFLFVLTISVCAQSALKGSRLIRMLITSSREFMADAAAVEATQNPAALVSALRRIDGRSHLPELPPGQDAMMIDGACEGALATHPTIARRIAAILAVTGSMGLIAPPRRDTRPAAGHTVFGSRIRASVFGTPPLPAIHGRRDLDPVGTDEDRNWLGLTPAMTIGAVLAVGLFLVQHRHELGQPAALAAVLDPRPAGALFAVAGRGMACNVAAIGSLSTGFSKPNWCTGTAMHDFTVAQAQVAGPAGKMLSSMTQAPEGMFMHPDGHFSTRPPPAAEAADIQAQRCFRTRGYTPGDRGWHRVDDPPQHDGGFDIKRWLEHSETLAGVAGAPGADDGLLKKYVVARKTNYETIDRFFGEPGLTVMRQAFASPAHRQAIQRLGARLRDLQWAASLSTVERAEYTLLADSPNDFITCMARRRLTAARAH